MKGIIGKKIGMTQVIDEKSGVVTPVTVIQAGPCFVTQVRSAERDGYVAVQLGYDEVPTFTHKDAKGHEEQRARKISKGELGHLQRANVPALRHLREFRVKQADVKEGDRVTVESFTKGEYVDVVGVSKGHGFAGGIKRHSFNRQPTTHGASDRTRSSGSSGATTTAGRVFKGTRRPGRMGNDRTTTQNLEVVVIDAERHLLAVKGSVPGAKGGLVIVKAAVKQADAKKVGVFKI